MTFGMLLGIVLSCTRLPAPADSTIRVRQGEVFTISLPSSIGTGYSWQLTKPVDGVHITFMSNRYKDASDLDGGQGTDVFTFRALKKGRVRLTFRYVRSWEKKPPTNTRYQSYSIFIL